MTLYVLKNRFTYQELEEIVGIFDSMSKLESAKVIYMRLMPELSEECFNFSYEEYILNTLK